MNEEDIRMLNSDFNYRHYGQFYEALEKKEKKDESDGDHKKGMPFEKLISENNLLNKMWSKVELDQKMTDNYEQWLEDEVWTYFD